MVELKRRLVRNRHMILQTAEKYGASNVRLFGSIARGEADDQSDIDILIDIEPGRSLLDHAALQIELERLLGCHVDVVTERGLKLAVRERVIKEAVQL